MTSKTWDAMSEAEKDADRDRLRRIVGDARAKMAEKPQATKSLVNIIDALLMADRIELGLTIASAMMAEERGYSDAMLGAVAMVNHEIINIERRTRDPLRN